MCNECISLIIFNLIPFNIEIKRYTIYIYICSVAVLYFRSFNTYNITNIDCMIGDLDLLKREYLNTNKGHVKEFNLDISNCLLKLTLKTTLSDLVSDNY